jgi:hypothetical protein
MSGPSRHWRNKEHTMTQHRQLPWALATIAALLTTPLATAAPGLYQTVNASGRYYTDDNILINNSIGQVFPTGDGSAFRFVTCVGSEPGSPGCVVAGPPPPPEAWYGLPALPSSAAAQAFTPDYGINQTRTWSRGTNGVGTGAPGYTQYSSFANSGWREEITTTATVPVVITFVVALHVDWNDGGLWAFQMGRPYPYDPDVGFAAMDGRTWSNCDVQEASGLCTFQYFTGSNLSVVPGGDNGGFDAIVTHEFTVFPDSFGNPEDPNPFTNPFEAVLGARSFANDSEVLGYSTASLQAILVPQGVSLTFASGHAYNVQVVPEPATYWLWALGLLAFVSAKRRSSAA